VSVQFQNTERANLLITMLTFVNQEKNVKSLEDTNQLMKKFFWDQFSVSEELKISNGKKLLNHVRI
jgi:16S rRNA G527 N7-methylase RsmG